MEPIDIRLLEIKRLRTKTIFQLSLFGMTLFFVPIGILMGVLGCFGFSTVSLNGQYITGISALFVGPIVGWLIAMLFGIFSAVAISLGLILLGKKQSTIIEFYPVDKKKKEQERVEVASTDS